MLVLLANVVFLCLVVRVGMQLRQAEAWVREQTAQAQQALEEELSSAESRQRNAMRRCRALKLNLEDLAGSLEEPGTGGIDEAQLRTMLAEAGCPGDMEVPATSGPSTDEGG